MSTLSKHILNGCIASQKFKSVADIEFDEIRLMVFTYNRRVFSTLDVILFSSTSSIPEFKTSINSYCQDGQTSIKLKSRYSLKQDVEYILTFSSISQDVYNSVSIPIYDHPDRSFSFNNRLTQDFSADFEFFLDGTIQPICNKPDFVIECEKSQVDDNNILTSEVQELSIVIETAPLKRRRGRPIKINK